MLGDQAVQLAIPSSPWGRRRLLDTVYLRDVWMHRIDIYRATGR